MKDKKNNEMPSIINDFNSKAAPHKVRNLAERLEDWHSFLASKCCDDYPALASFEESYHQIDSIFEERGGEITQISSQGILGILSFYIDAGDYPPPEVLLVLHDLWRIYLASEGRYTLEDIFIGGRSKPKVGNKAIQQEKALSELLKIYRYQKYLSNGLTQIEAAEKIKEEYYLLAEPESIVRMMRKAEKGDFINPLLQEDY